MVHTKIWNYYKSCTKSWAIFLPGRRGDVPFHAGFCSLFRPECRNVAACAGIRGQIRPECSVATFYAGMGYHFRRGKEKCLRLHGNPWLNLPGMLRGNILRGN